MRGRFAQSQTREEYLAYLADEAERDITYDLSRLGVTTWRRGLKFCS
ncbi:hypothetical protein SAMN03159351_01153 [Klebsiella quasipneumoniae]|uniref:Gifsy-2 prophage protein n=1 Tax=Klebsiella pneumoniae TaxID=573 RepID=A0A486D4U6_KLEPN|nr:hypothetical protein L425_02003 [Klebsiella quasipneumoniae subsp. quasipneumoniae]SCW43934.1 hypothetical protein SAMN03159472_01151 [Klebsiella quasipneumoniae]VGM00901.1 Gifsy-2 prophage protein [Klebsiella pneumoniae]SCX49232.1 hypothetical protein SAMN03159387_2061 [Klebsiella quasipneumoniae]SCX52037.1 hypothetical protein SAMN03159426_01624 [Klebsiella quasipneumoniae]